MKCVPVGSITTEPGVLLSIPPHPYFFPQTVRSARRLRCVGFENRCKAVNRLCTCTYRAELKINKDKPTMYLNMLLLLNNWKKNNRRTGHSDSAVSEQWLYIHFHYPYQTCFVLYTKSSSRIWTGKTYVMFFDVFPVRLLLWIEKSWILEQSPLSWWRLDLETTSNQAPGLMFSELYIKVLLRIMAKNNI